jgi:hypothetical protein
VQNAHITVAALSKRVLPTALRQSKSAGIFQKENGILC